MLVLVFRGDVLLAGRLTARRLFLPQTRATADSVSGRRWGGHRGWWSQYLREYEMETCLPLFGIGITLEVVLLV